MVLGGSRHEVGGLRGVGGSAAGLFLSMVGSEEVPWNRCPQFMYDSLFFLSFFSFIRRTKPRVMTLLLLFH